MKQSRRVVGPPVLKAGSSRNQKRHQTRKLFPRGMQMVLQYLSIVQPSLWEISLIDPFTVWQSSGKCGSIFRDHIQFLKKRFWEVCVTIDRDSCSRDCWNPSTYQLLKWPTLFLFFSYFLGERTYKCFYSGTRPNSGYGGAPMYRSWHGITAVTGNVSILLHQGLVSWSFCDPGGGSLCLLPFNSVYPCQRNPTYRHGGCCDTQTKVYSTQEKIEPRLQQLKSSY
jgi:hypothetical protein